MPEDRQSVRPKGYQFGTFGGVFTPSLLTIFGLIMFMRANYVVGHAGVGHTLLILTISSGITLLTSLSLSAISTNTPVAGGGAYFLISRVLGPGFGTAIGIALFVAQALSVPFYVLGFAEALVNTFAVPAAYFRWICLGATVLLFGITWVGAGLAIKCQYFILAVLSASIVVALVGLGLRFDPAQFQENLRPQYVGGASLWSMFAIYFPAVTGIMAGVNMSGDLKDPARSIPRGTLAAIALSYVVYAALAVLGGGLTDAATLREEPFRLLVDNAWLQLGFLVIAGVYCATLSSAIGSYLGAPRVLQAVARDGVIRPLAPFARGTGKGDDPRRALLVTFGIAIVTILLAGGAEGGTGLNMVAAVVTMVFLYTYGMTNLAAFVESFGANPSFRPRFRYYHWSTALLGGVACIWTAFQINAGAATGAALLLGVLLLLARNLEAMTAYGDARRGFVYQRIRNNLYSLARMPMHPKNWRPTVLVFSGNPNARLSLITYARWLGVNCGIVSLVSVLRGELEDLHEAREEEKKRLLNFVETNELEIFPEVVAMPDFDRDLGLFLQSYSIGPIKPNIVLFGWPREPERLAPYFHHLRTVKGLAKSLVVVIDKGLMLSRPAKRIDCWWRGRQNGSLMVILAHLIMQNSEWKGTRLRLLRSATKEEDVEETTGDLQSICDAARIPAEIVVPVSQKSFTEILREHSEDASLILLGFIPPTPEAQVPFFDTIASMLDQMPSTILVSSSGEADLLA